MESIVVGSKKQVWLARTCIVVLIGLIVSLKLFGFEVVVAERGDTTYYRGSAFMSVVSILFGGVCLMMGAMYWRQPSWFYRAIGIVIFVVGLSLLVLMAPIPFTHGVFVSRDQFTCRTGYWFAPEEINVKFNRLGFVQVSRDEDDSSSRNQKPRYRLECADKQSGNIIRVPINDMMKEALPTIFTHLAAHNVTVLDSPEGWQIPPM